MTGYSTWTDNAAPPGTYDLVVLTLPWIAYPGLTIPESSTTIVPIELGAIRPLTPDGQEAMVDIYQAASGERLGYYGGLCCWCRTHTGWQSTRAGVTRSS